MANNSKSKGPRPLFFAKMSFSGQNAPACKFWRRSKYPSISLIPKVVPLGKKRPENAFFAKYLQYKIFRSVLTWKTHFWKKKCSRPDIFWIIEGFILKIIGKFFFSQVLDIIIFGSVLIWKVHFCKKNCSRTASFWVIDNFIKKSMIYS